MIAGLFSLLSIGNSHADPSTKSPSSLRCLATALAVDSLRSLIACTPPSPRSVPALLRSLSLSSSPAPRPLPSCPSALSPLCASTPPSSSAIGSLRVSTPPCSSALSPLCASAPPSPHPVQALLRFLSFSFCPVQCLSAALAIGFLLLARLYSALFSPCAAPLHRPLPPQEMYTIKYNPFFFSLFFLSPSLRDRGVLMP